MICVTEGGTVSRGRNVGLDETTTPYIFFIVEDTRLQIRLASALPEKMGVAKKS
jgi:hypothetical protein